MPVGQVDKRGTDKRPGGHRRRDSALDLEFKKHRQTEFCTCDPRSDTHKVFIRVERKAQRGI